MTIATPHWTTARATSGPSNESEGATSAAVVSDGAAFGDGCDVTRPRARTEPLAA
ncbi:hypothetical protein [Halostella litorea]|uniref:hypothetical protein n=1 Tax=Halostella litorea TaxID=2528831 RepID=UPI001386C2CB|nr:hypothetical protein [Halostella litorea]